MSMGPRAWLLLAAAIAPAAMALDSPQWPPPDATAQRMRELQERIRDGESTLAQREAAREELSGLLKSPAGQRRGRTADEKPPRPARAAIEPFGSVKPVPVTPLPPPPSGDVARLEVVVPPRPLVDPRTGSVAVPVAPEARFAIDPRTGHVLHGTGSGYVDPLTGQFR